MFKNRNNRTYRETLYLNQTAPKLPLIHSRRALTISVVLFILVMTLSFRFPGSSSIIERIFMTIGVPTSSEGYGMGIQYANIFVLSLIMILLFTANYALSRGRTMIVVVLFIVISTGPNWLTTNYERYLASGIYAVTVDMKESRCFYTIDQGKFTGHCQLTMINNNNYIVEVQPLLEIPWYRTTSKNTLPDIKLKSVTLQPRETKVYRTESSQATIENYMDRGHEEGGLEIKLSNGKYDRRYYTKN